jgi:hypothetical protein
MSNGSWDGEERRTGVVTLTEDQIDAITARHQAAGRAILPEDHAAIIADATAKMAARL